MYIVKAVIRNDDQIKGVLVARCYDRDDVFIGMFCHRYLTGILDLLVWNYGDLAHIYQDISIY